MKTYEQVNIKIHDLIFEAKLSDKKAHEEFKKGNVAGRELHEQEARGARLQAFILTWALTDE